MADLISLIVSTYNREDALAAVLRPREVVVTDRCWSFLATWLLHTRTLAALEPQDTPAR